MNALTLAFELAFPLALGAFAARYLSGALHALLEDLCGTAVRAVFWMRITTVLILLLPSLLTLVFVDTEGADSVVALLRHTVVYSIVGTLLAAGLVSRVIYRAISRPAARDSAAPKATA